MDSIINQNYQQNNSGLLRFRSAPTSFIENFTYSNNNMDSIEKDGGLETEKLNSRFMNSGNVSTDLSFIDAAYGLPPNYPRDGSCRIPCSMTMDQQINPKSVSPNLLRQSSSPAGIFANLSGQTGYASIKGSDDDARLYSPGFTFGSWNESSHFPEDFHGVKVVDREKLFSGSQNGDFGNRFHVLSHHLSLPKTSSHMNAVEKFLGFHDAAPCKIRAKRGCATHPRSIAERVRRTRISERMRKLQELVPNMDKQTNTADMLDLAVDYIKDLQKQYKTLSDIRAKCKCPSIQKAVPNQVDMIMFCTEK